MASRGKEIIASDAFHYDEEVVLCDCGLRAARRISRTSANPNREFFGCPLFNRSENNKACDYFEWYDIRVAVFKATTSLSGKLSRLEAENGQLRSLLGRLMKDGARTQEQTDLFIELELIKQKLERLELEGTSRK
ncbi:unnamed protein product [Linum tenue]|uniref:GRF-type domain-containing protein n=1 Tax=Linum tenue TaxID=586396 RepID=A0AAV0MHT2_9ROSI|nr:unnamed protein product [Linum tenue]